MSELKCKECTGYELDLSLTLKDLLTIYEKHIQLNKEHYGHYKRCECLACRITDKINTIIKESGDLN